MFAVDVFVLFVHDGQVKCLLCVYTVLHYTLKAGCSIRLYLLFIKLQKKKMGQNLLIEQKSLRKHF